MTAISTVITSTCTAHATDSFITTPAANGGFDVIESQETKIVKVEAFRGAMSYWGWATTPADGSRWNTLRWLRQAAAQAGSFGTASAFAESMARDLSTAASRFRFDPLRAGGLGIHFTAYEPIDGDWVPELFLISNWTDASYSAVRPSGFAATRQTFAMLSEASDKSIDHASPIARIAVLNALRDGMLYYFNNGDPAVYNPIANAMYATISTLKTRKQFRGNTVDSDRALARQPIEVVTRILRSFSKAGTRVVGGKPHDVAVTPDGTYTSSTGG